MFNFYILTKLTKSLKYRRLNFTLLLHLKLLNGEATINIYLIFKPCRITIHGEKVAKN